ncbi:MAG: transglutaminase domain-containing protein [Puniceicoccaceae bacterium]
MIFEVTHTTDYRYSSTASESVGELRVFPVDDENQTVSRRLLEIHPQVEVDSYTDYYGNRAEWFAVPFRHERLTIRSSSLVVTTPSIFPQPCLELSVAETRQIARKQHALYDFLAPSRRVPQSVALHLGGRHLLAPATSIEEAVVRLNEWIHDNFEYQSGATEVDTPLSKVIEQRKGVCQDFSHLMLAILRSAGIPCRYVSGYIEPFDPTSEAEDRAALIGAAASHAWVEVWLSGGHWAGFDPTNRQRAGERHIRVAVGRDYSDVPPFRGTFKGAVGHNLRVEVEIKRPEVSKAAE